MLNSTIIAYKIGEIAADFIMISIGGQTGLKLYAGLNSVAKLHKIASDDSDIVFENLFQCLPYLE